MSESGETRPLEIPAALNATLVLVRHGESVWIAEGRFQGRRDPVLSELGRRQAELVASRLADHRSVALPIPDGPPKGVWHSPLSRAAETAQAIARAQPVESPMHVLEELTEIAQGEWEGLPHAEVSARWPDELARWRRTPSVAHAPGGEPLLAAAQRVRSGGARLLHTMEADHGVGAAPPGDGGDAASAARSPVPGYPGPSSAAAARTEPWAVLVAHDGIFRLLLMSLLGIPYERFWSLPFHLCGISIVSLADGVAALRSHNVTDHLAPLADEARALAEARGDRRGAL